MDVRSPGGKEEEEFKKVKGIMESPYPVFFEDETKKYITTIVRRVIARRGSKPVIRTIQRWDICDMCPQCPERGGICDDER